MDKINEKYFGVIIEMAQRRRNVCVKDKLKIMNDNFWKYELFGHFDDMRITVVEDLYSLYSKNTDITKLKDTTDRLLYRSEFQKIFLYAKDDENGSKRCIADRFADGSFKFSKEPSCQLFVSLIAIKYRYPFFDSVQWDSCRCTELFMQKYIDNHTTSTISFCVLNSLSIDDVYILIASNNPNEIMHCVCEIQDYMSDYNGDLEEYNITTQNDDAFKSSLTKLNALKNKLIKRKFKNQNLFEKLLLIADNCIESISTYKQSRKKLLTLDEIKTIIADARKEFDKYYELFCKSNIENAFDASNWLLDCINSVRICGYVPIVLQTHTIIGVRQDADINESKYAMYLNEPVLFELHMQSNPGVDITYCLKNELPEVFDLKMRLGRHDTTSSNCMPLKELFALYNSDLLDANNLEPNNSIRYSAGSFLNSPGNVPNENDIIFDTGIVRKDVKEIKMEMLREYNMLGNIWVKTQHEFAIKHFDVIRNNAKDENNKPYQFLHLLINEIDELHIQGCRRFFYTLNWYQFKDTRKFFTNFYSKLESIFKLLGEIKEPNMKKNHAYMIAKGLEQTAKVFSHMFHDRLITDMSAYDNTRPSQYATGAYEVLLKSYSNWLKYLRGILIAFDSDFKFEERDKMFNFILVPVERDGIHSHSIFPVSNDNHTLIIYSAPFNSMLDIPNALAIFVHEAGHSMGIVGRKHRVKTYLNMVPRLKNQMQQTQ